MNQKELALRLDVSASFVSEVESGKKTPSVSMLEKYAEVFEMPLSSILFFSENLDSPSSSEVTRSYVAKKIISLMKFIAERSGRDG